jgi:RNA polymerase sigma-70 factor (ECF subfamily)
VIVLRYQEELGPEEIAELLGMPVATVKSHLQRALKVLRARMQQRPIRAGAQRPAN